MGADLDCCVGVEERDQELTAAIKLDLKKKTMESEKNVNRHFKVQKKMEIQNERGSIRVDTKEEKEESITNGQGVCSSHRHSSDMDLVAETDDSVDSIDSIIHVIHAHCGAL